MNLIISGISCSGKTTLSNEIKQLYEDTTIFREDDYMKNIDSIPRYRGYLLMDVENAYLVDEYVKDVYKLLTFGSVNYPEYDVYRNMRLNKDKVVNKNEISVFEGLHTIDILKNLRNSIRIFMDTDLETCLERRIKRDTLLYKISEEEIIKYWNQVILKSYMPYIELQKSMADYVIRGKENEKCLLKKLQIY